VSQRPTGNDRRLSYDVRVWAIRKRPRGKGKGVAYVVRWTVGGRPFQRTYDTWALADSRRSELKIAQNQGQAFDRETGVPVAELVRAQDERSWYQHAVDYVDRKWDTAAGNSRSSIAETLATVTPALLPDERGRPDDDTLRKALYGWAFNKQRRITQQPPGKIARALRWVERNTVPLSALADRHVVLDALDALARRKDGTPAAANTVARKRAVLYNVLEHAVGRGLEVNPLPQAAKLWSPPKTVETVDPRVVINRLQADELLAAVGQQPAQGPRLVAFFGCIYYAALRPGEVVDLRDEENLDLPVKGWGTFYVRRSSPAVGRAWTDSGERRERRQLKHRGDNEVRPVPCAPPLTRLIRHHLKEYGTAPDGRLFPGARGGPLSESVYGRIWEAARAVALTPAEVASPLAKRPYDLRHACLSAWLNAGVDPAQVAEWAGNSVNVVLRVYTKCVVGRDEIARRRIQNALEEEFEGEDDQ
jgi:integrase